MATSCLNVVNAQLNISSGRPFSAWVCTSRCSLIPHAPDQPLPQTRFRRETIPSPRCARQTAHAVPRASPIAPLRQPLAVLAPATVAIDTVLLQWSHDTALEVRWLAK